MTERLVAFTKNCAEGQRIFKLKNKQYGDSIRFGGVIAACYNIVGAAMRLPQLVFYSKEHGRKSKDKLIDILLDVHNYANIALLMIQDNNWEGKLD